MADSNISTPIKSSVRTTGNIFLSATRLLKKKQNGLSRMEKKLLPNRFGWSFLAYIYFLSSISLRYRSEYISSFAIVSVAGLP